MTRWAPWVQRRLDAVENDLSTERRAAERRWKEVSSARRFEVINIKDVRPKWRQEARNAA